MKIRAPRATLEYPQTHLDKRRRSLWNDRYVGIDLHHRSSTIYRMAEDGEMFGCVRIPSQPVELAQAMAAAGEGPEVVLESTYGWYWAADLLQEMGAQVHLATLSATNGGIVG